MAEPRRVASSAALPPAERTIGQLVGESIRFYGDHFWPCLALGLAPAALAVVSANVSRTVAIVLSPTLFGALLSATYVGASVLVLERRPDDRRLVVAWLVGWLVFAPVPFLVLGFVIPGSRGWRRSGSSSRSSSSRRRRCEQPSRAPGSSHGPTSCTRSASLVTLAILVLLTQAVLAFILRSFGGAGVSVAFFLASVIVSPLLFIGAALLLRRPGRAGRGRVGSRHADLHPALAPLPAGRPDAPDAIRPACSEVNRDVEELGAKVLHQWATLGEFDFVNVVEAPDTATIAKVSVALGARGSTQDPDAARALDRRVRLDDRVASPRRRRAGR